MTLFLFKCLSATLIFMVTLIPGLWVFKPERAMPNSSPMQQALARGIFFGLALLHLIPEALSTHPQSMYPWPMLACAFFFILLLWLEHLTQDSKTLPILATLTLSLHSILMGSALGLSTQIMTTLTMLGAILVHKYQESFALSSLLKRNQRSKTYFLIFTIMTPLGILCSSWMAHMIHHVNDNLYEIMIGGSAGSLLYLGTLHGYLPEGGRPAQCCNIRQFAGFVLGFALMALLTTV